MRPGQQRNQKQKYPDEEYFSTHFSADIPDNSNSCRFLPVPTLFLVFFNAGETVLLVFFGSTGRLMDRLDVYDAIQCDRIFWPPHSQCFIHWNRNSPYAAYERYFVDLLLLAVKLKPIHHCYITLTITAITVLYSLWNAGNTIVIPRSSG